MRQYHHDPKKTPQGTMMDFIDKEILREDSYLMPQVDHKF